MEEEELPAEAVDLVEEAVAAVDLVTVIVEVVEAEAVAAAEMAEVNKLTFLPAQVTGNAQFSTAETQTLPGETTATNAKPLNQLEPEAVVMTEVEIAEEVEEVFAVAAVVVQLRWLQLG